MELDAVMLARIQFGFTVAFHIIFPAFTIGLASWLVLLEFRWLRSGNLLFKHLFKFWAKVFAVSFGLGVVSGIVMSYQFGTNWSGYAEFTDNILGPVIAYEVITAFFLEAAFLGISWMQTPAGYAMPRTIQATLAEILSYSAEIC